MSISPSIKLINECLERILAEAKKDHIDFTDEEIKKLFSKYSNIDFGIGIDDGKILCTKVGLSGFNNRDLVWIGNPVNKSVKIGDNLKSPYHIGISSHVYNNLTDDVKYHEKENHFFNFKKSLIA